VLGRSSKYIDTNWEAVLYMSSAHFLYYLPAILLAVREYPKRQMARILVHGRFQRESKLFTDEERAAVDCVVLYLSLHGVTAESVLRSIERGKEQMKTWMETNPDAL